MRNFAKKMLAAVLAMALGASVLAGCSTVKPEDYASTVVATLGDEKIYLDEANFYLKSDQYYYEMMYSYMYGTTDIWNQQISAAGTMADTLRAAIMTTLRQTYILCSHADELGISLSEADMVKIEQAVDDNLAQIDEKLLEAMNVSRERMVEIFSKNALANLVWEAVVSTADTVVPDEEARCVGVSYVLVKQEESAGGSGETAAESTAADDGSADGETAADGSPVPVEAQAKAKEIYDAVLGGSTLADAASAYGLTPTVTNYYTGDTFGEETLGFHALSMKKGDAEMFQLEGDENWYVMVLDSELDETATEAKRDEIIEKRKAAAFETQYTEWQKTSPEFKVEDKIWKSVPFDTLFVLPEETTADTTSAEDGGTTAADGMTEGGSGAADDGMTEDGSAAAADGSTEDGGTAAG